MGYKLQDLIDIDHFQNLQDRLNKIYAFPSSIIDNNGNILTATAWQEVCTQFHRKNKETEKLCIQSDLYIKDHIHEADPALTYRCPHGLVDNAAPIIIDGVHYGNFFTGQFFLEQAPDLAYFRSQARKYGFDETAYLAAVKKVPVWSQEQLDHYLFFIRGLIEIIAESGLKKLREIENRKQIQINEQRNRAILKTAMDGFWATNLDGRLVEVNDAYCRMSGYSETELLCLHIWDLDSFETRDQVIEHIQNVMLSGPERFESSHRKKDGTLFDVEISAQFRPEHGGQCICFLRDISGRVQAEAEREKLLNQLSQKEKMESIGRLAGGVAHDFNNLLGVILGNTELAMLQTDKDHDLHSTLKEIQKAAQRSADLTKQLLTFARKDMISPKQLDLNDTVESRLNFLRRLIGDRISLIWKPGPSLWPVKMDPSQIHQILANLCANARDAIDGAGTITIKTQKFLIDEDFCSRMPDAVSGDHVMLSVSDNGCGMDKETLDNLFEPFFTTKGLGRGTGLGLASVYGIIKQNNGSIDVSSKPGQGSTFNIFLPRLSA